MTTKISYAIAFVLGLGMVFLGARFFFSPEVATTAFGIRFNAKLNSTTTVKNFNARP